MRKLINYVMQKSVHSTFALSIPTLCSLSAWLLAVRVSVLVWLLAVRVSVLVWSCGVSVSVVVVWSSAVWREMAVSSSSSVDNSELVSSSPEKSSSLPILYQGWEYYCGIKRTKTFEHLSIVGLTYFIATCISMSVGKPKSKERFEQYIIVGRFTIATFLTFRLRILL